MNVLLKDWESHSCEHVDLRESVSGAEYEAQLNVKATWLERALVSLSAKEPSTEA